MANPGGISIASFADQCQVGTRFDEKQTGSNPDRRPAMSRIAPNRILSAVATIVPMAVVLMCCAAFAGKAEVVDSAGFFSADAVSQANQKLADIDSKFGRHMRVETFAEIPGDLRGQYNEAT